MKTNNKQQTDLEICLYFMPETLRHILITEADEQKFFEWSEKGLHKEDVRDSYFTDGFNALVSAKQWRGRHMEIYEEGVLSGNMPYFVLLGGFGGQRRKWWEFWKSRFAHSPIPRFVVDFMKREMFKGMDAKIIEKCYHDILCEVK